MEKRKCKTCKLIKSLNEFANAGIINGKRYYRHLCVNCYSKSKQPLKDKIRESYFKIKQSEKCENCGENDFRVLDFDHKDPKTKSFNVSDGIRRGYSFDKIKREIKKCRVLCANCHRRKTWCENRKPPDTL